MVINEATVSGEATPPENTTNPATWQLTRFAGVEVNRLRRVSWFFVLLTAKLAATRKIEDAEDTRWKMMAEGRLLDLFVMFPLRFFN